jgi:hypothetical protein
MKNFLSLCLLIFLSNAASAQIKNFRFGASVNAAIIPDVISKSEITLTGIPNFGSDVLLNIGIIRETYEIQPGFNLKLSFDGRMSQRFFFTTGLTFSYLKYKRTIIIDEVSGLGNIDLPWPGAPSSGITQYLGLVSSALFDGEIDLQNIPILGELDFDPNDERIGNTTIYTIQVPFLIGTSVFKKKVGLRAGVLASYVLDANSYEVFFLSMGENNTSEQFTPFSGAVVAQIDFNITKGIALELSGQHFVTPLYTKKYQVAGRAMLNSVSAGLSFKF